MSGASTVPAAKHDFKCVDWLLDEKKNSLKFEYPHGL